MDTEPQKKAPTIRNQIGAGVVVIIGLLLVFLLLKGCSSVVRKTGNFFDSPGQLQSELDAINALPSLRSSQSAT